ncbi:helix-turn-helix domain-containing protein [Rhodoferax antarcticus]|uniref:helix-turn-helix domain-containing protein n=1 Tax=Rhodoferax antarcticus TaxID=81479 RepID=UPI003B846100
MSKGHTQTLLARQLGVSQAVVGNVIHDRITAYSVAQHIAQVVGLEIRELWPTRYSFKPRGPSANRRQRPVPTQKEIPPMP